MASDACAHEFVEDSGGVFRCKYCQVTPEEAYLLQSRATLQANTGSHLSRYDCQHQFAKQPDGSYRCSLCDSTPEEAFTTPKSEHAQGPLPILPLGVLPNYIGKRDARISSALRKSRLIELGFGWTTIGSALFVGICLFVIMYQFGETRMSRFDIKWLLFGIFLIVIVYMARGSFKLIAWNLGGMKRSNYIAQHSVDIPTELTAFSAAVEEVSGRAGIYAPFLSSINKSGANTMVAFSRSSYGFMSSTNPGAARRSVAVTTGLLDLALTDRELLAVAAVCAGQIVALPNFKRYQIRGYLGFAAAFPGALIVLSTGQLVAAISLAIIAGFVVLASPFIESRYDYYSRYNMLLSDSIGVELTKNPEALSSALKKVAEAVGTSEDWREERSFYELFLDPGSAAASWRVRRPPFLPAKAVSLLDETPDLLDARLKNLEMISRGERTVF